MIHLFIENHYYILLIVFLIILICSCLKDIIKTNFDKKNRYYNILIKSLICTGFICLLYNYNSNPQEIVSPLAIENEILISEAINIPLKETSKIDLERLEARINNIINDDNISVYFQSLTSDDSIHIGSNTIFNAASSFKIVTVLALYDYAFENNIDLRKTYISYTANDFEGGSGYLQNTIKVGDKFSLYDLSNKLIVSSDNIAWKMIIRYIGKDYHINYYKEKTNSNQSFFNNLYFLTGEYANIFLKQIYENKNDNPYYYNLIYNMKTTECHDAIDKYIIPNSLVAHKIGLLTVNGIRYVNDIGIIEGDYPYTLVLLSSTKKGDNYMFEKFALISKEIHDMIYN